MLNIELFRTVTFRNGCGMAVALMQPSSLHLCPVQPGQVLQAGAIILTSFCHQHYLFADNFIIDDPDLPAFPETAEQAHARINVALEVEFLYHACWT